MNDCTKHPKARSIMLIPRFARVDLIEDIRSRFDPLHGKVAPHITIVFPFESPILNHQLEEHVAACASETAPFDLVAMGASGFQDEWLFLNIKKGNDQIIRLHDALYEGVLASFYSHRHCYIPHITLGRLNRTDLFDTALNEVKGLAHSFPARIDEIIIEEIQDDNSSLILKRVQLG